MLCPLCERAQVYEQTYTDHFKRRDEEYGVTVKGLKGYYCGKCDNYSMSPAQARYNLKLINKAREERDGTLESSTSG